MFNLEKYTGMRTRYTCPSCSAKRVFVRYVNEYGEYLADNVGRCNREAKCGYHYPPRQYFADNPDLAKDHNLDQSSRPKHRPIEPPKKVKPTFHSRKLLESTLGRHDQNPFVRFLFNLFPDRREKVIAAVDRYKVGLYSGLTCFWQIDINGHIRKGKLMRYSPATGKRQPVYEWTDEDGSQVELPIYWVHRKLQKKGEIPESAEFHGCFFGEHLLADATQEIGIVESEKTAIICSIYRPEKIWIAVGAQRHITNGKIRVLRGRSVTLYPDTDSFELWRAKLAVLRLQFGVDAKISRFLEENVAAEQKADGYDLADFVIDRLTSHRCRKQPLQRQMAHH
jgi:hypothetical protein